MRINEAHTHSSVVVQVNLDVTSNDSSQCPDQLVDLSGVGAADRVSDADSVNANLINGLINGKEVHEVRSERILRGESDFNALGLDELDNLDGSLGDVGHILSVRKFSQERGRANNDVDTVDTCNAREESLNIGMTTCK